MVNESITLCTPWSNRITPSLGNNLILVLQVYRILADCAIRTPNCL